MSALVTQARLDTVLDVPIVLPQAELLRGSSQVISATRVTLGQRLYLGMLSLHLVKATAGLPDLVNTSLGMTYVGVYTGDDGVELTGLPVHVISLTGPFVRPLSPGFRCFHGPDVVKVAVVNNTENLDLEVVVNGAAKLYLA